MPTRRYVLAAGAAGILSAATGIVPQARAAIVAVSLFHFFWAWNEFFLPLVYLQSVPEMQPLAVGLARFNALYSQEPTLIQAAAIMVRSSRTWASPLRAICLFAMASVNVTQTCFLWRISS